ncbi:uncharacterized protein LOC113548720 [Rhopalosiphum maidis]|uniref:uncharacterized protein LOC113548720 n=1 Tax=Rhopalosiphum maidis TaxID=43146 RepID=UPI000EFE0B6A|nr:uncharacterized protein LOC113548720 [Rhopalosiphum maidis]
MSKSEMDNIETENYKLRDKQKTLENDNDIEDIHRDNICIENPTEFTSNLYESQDNNKSYDLMAKEQLENIFNHQSNVMDSTSPTELLHFEDMSSESENLVNNYYSRALEIETETSKKSSDDTSLEFERINSEMTYVTPKSINKEIYNSQLIVLEPNNPVMVRFQKTLKLHLLKQRENIKKELQTLDGSIRSRQKEKSSFINEINNVACRVDTQHKLLNEFHRMKLELKITKDRVEECTEQRKQRYTEIHTTTTIESKKFSTLKRQLECSRGLLKELLKYEKEQEITFNICNQKKSETKQYKKKLLNDQQKQDLLLLSLTQEILRLEDRMKQLGEQAETKYNEREVLRQKVMNNSTELDAINEDNAKITLLWNDVLISIQQCDKCFLRTKNDLQEAKNKYHTLLMEANSYKRSAKEEFRKNKDLFNYLNKLKREQNNLQNSFKTCLDKLNCLKEEYSKLIQMTEFQQQNLDQITLELVLVEVENNLSKSLLKLEQYRTTSSNLEHDIEENTKYLNDQGYDLVMETKNKKLDKEIASLSKEVYQYKQTLTNMRNTMLKLNEQFSQNKGKSSMLLNENEWIQCSYLAELKVNVNTRISNVLPNYPYKYINIY